MDILEKLNAELERSKVEFTMLRHRAEQLSPNSMCFEQLFSELQELAKRTHAVAEQLGAEVQAIVQGKPISLH
jgi:hypothetical protein